MLLYLWLILTIPTDRFVCELWTREIPTQAALVQACGTDALGNYRLDVLRNGAGTCSVPAASLFTVQSACALTESLDAYRLRIVEPEYQTSLCAVDTPTQDAPAWTVIVEQCPGAKKYGQNGITLRYWTTRQATPEADPICKPPPIEQPATIATKNEYYWLAGKLIWYGLAKANCDGGYSGLDPMTKAAIPCGMDGARSTVYEWQNGMDAEIIAAAREWNVPAALLKQLIADETQFWTWTGVNGEHGMIQITDAGAMVVMHMYQPGYYQMTDKQKQNARSTWLQKLDCFNCSPVQAYEHAKRSMNYYAQALAAYYCMYNSWDAALTAWNIKHKEN